MVNHTTLKTRGRSQDVLEAFACGSLGHELDAEGNIPSLLGGRQVHRLVKFRPAGMLFQPYDVAPYL